MTESRQGKYTVSKLHSTSSLHKMRFSLKLFRNTNTHWAVSNGIKIKKRRCSRICTYGGAMLDTGTD